MNNYNIIWMFFCCLFVYLPLYLYLAGACPPPLFQKQYWTFYSPKTYLMLKKQEKLQGPHRNSACSSSPSPLESALIPNQCKQPAGNSTCLCNVRTPKITKDRGHKTFLPKNWKTTFEIKIPPLLAGRDFPTMKHIGFSWSVCI